MDYKVILTKDIETGWLGAEAASLPGCISQGKNRKEALENIRDAINGYLESIRKHPEEKGFEKFYAVEVVSV